MSESKGIVKHNMIDFCQRTLNVTGDKVAKVTVPAWSPSGKEGGCLLLLGELYFLWLQLERFKPSMELWFIGRAYSALSVEPGEKCGPCPVSGVCLSRRLLSPECVHRNHFNVYLPKHSTWLFTVFSIFSTCCNRNCRDVSLRVWDGFCMAINSSLKTNQKPKQNKRMK